MLTECEAVAIYEIKIKLKNRIMQDLLPPRSLRSLWGQAGPLSKRYGVSSRTVKYIWNRQTWAHATSHLWQDEPEIENIESPRRLFKHNTCMSHSDIGSQPTVSLSQGSRIGPCTTTPLPFQPTQFPLDAMNGATSGAASGAACSVSGKAASWIQPDAVIVSGGPPEKPRMCAEPQQIKKAAASDSHFCTESTPCAPFQNMMASPLELAVAVAIHAPVSEIRSPPWLDLMLELTLGADPFHADWPHW
jgi:hypothetical protein